MKPLGTASHPTDDKETPQRHRGWLAVGFTLAILFIFMALLRLHWQTGVAVSEAAVQDRWISILVSDGALLVYQIVCAGVLGGFLERLTTLSATWATADARRAELAKLSGILLFAGAAGFAVGFLIPAALLRETGNLAASFNPWALIALAAIAGFYANTAFGEVGAVLSHFFDEAKLGEAAQTISARVERSVDERLRNTFGRPEPIRYDGFMFVQILDSDRNTVHLLQDLETHYRLDAGAHCILKVFFSPSDLSGTLPLADTVRERVLISEGRSDQEVPFELTVDFDNFAAAQTSRRLRVPAAARSDEEAFEFEVQRRLPDLPRINQDSIPTERETIDEKELAESWIYVIVRQHNQSVSSVRCKVLVT